MHLINSLAMYLQEQEGETIFFRSTKMVFKTTLVQADGLYSIIHMTHLPEMGPALHVHPHGCESFWVLDGDYFFVCDGKEIHAQTNDFVLIPKGIPHRYTSGKLGGKMLVTTPASIETYFRTVAEQLKTAEISLEEEFALAEKCGQTFLEHTGHWGHR